MKLVLAEMLCMILVQKRARGGGGAGGGGARGGEEVWWQEECAVAGRTPFLGGGSTIEPSSPTGRGSTSTSTQDWAGAPPGVVEAANGPSLPQQPASSTAPLPQQHRNASTARPQQPDNLQWTGNHHNSYPVHDQWTDDHRIRSSVPDHDDQWIVLGLLNDTSVQDLATATYDQRTGHHVDQWTKGQRYLNTASTFPRGHPNSTLYHVSMGFSSSPVGIALHRMYQVTLPARGHFGRVRCGHVRVWYCNICVW